jgi:hypothetical protein
MRILTELVGGVILLVTFAYGMAGVINMFHKQLERTNAPDQNDGPTGTSDDAARPTGPGQPS